MTKPRVTVGVCVRNCGDFIKECIESIVYQDFPHELMEIVFVDDGSEDSTLSVIKNYAPKMNVDVKIFNQKWKGLGSARNFVVDIARGDYIVWVDGDMLLSTDYISKLVEFMEKNPKVGIAKGKYSLIPGANWIATLEIYSRVASKMVNFNSEGSMRKDSKSMGTGGSIYRVKAVMEAGSFDSNVRGYGEDWDIEYRIRMAGWLLGTVESEFRDYERRGLTWRDIWHKFLQRGRDSHDLVRRKKVMIRLYRWTPLAAFLLGLVHSLTIYKITHQKKVFLLPIQYAFKMTAWWIGFLKSKQTI